MLAPGTTRSLAGDRSAGLWDGMGILTGEEFSSCSRGTGRHQQLAALVGHPVPGFLLTGHRGPALFLHVVCLLPRADVPQFLEFLDLLRIRVEADDTHRG